MSRPATLGAGLPPGFMLGTATASHQIEGGTSNDWSAWERFEVDLGLMRALGASAYRFRKDTKAMATGSTADVTAAGLTDAFFNESVPQALRTGRIRLSFPAQVSIDREVEGLRDSFDYLGINHYSRGFVRQDFGEAPLSNQYVPDGRPVNDLGWDIYPEGLFLFLRRFRDMGVPLLVTENGMADAAGTRRPDFLRSHLYAVGQAVKEGVDVRGYFHWSLMDNVETFQDVARSLGLTPAP